MLVKMIFFFFSSRRRHTRWTGDWSSDVCSSDLKPVQVSVGPDEAQRTVFDGLISAIEVVFGDSEPPRVVVLAEDALMRLRMTRRMRSYTNVTDADIADAIANDHGLQSDTAVDGPTYDVVQQLNQSDLAFLRDRARLVQAELW